jgi:hypothetical protein
MELRIVQQTRLTQTWHPHRAANTLVTQNALNLTKSLAPHALTENGLRPHEM